MPGEALGFRSPTDRRNGECHHAEQPDAHPQPPGELQFSRRKPGPPPGGGLLAVESTGTSVNYTTAAADSTMNSAMIGNAGSNALWSVNLDGSGLALVRNHLTNAPLGIGLDVFSQKIYGTDSSGIT